MTNPEKPGLRSLLLDMADKDQKVRKLTLGVTPSDKLAQNIRDIDKSNTEKLKTIIEKNGVPTSSMVGRDGIQAFWLLAQHSIDYDFQCTLLPHLKAAFNEGSIDAQIYANFVDRVLVHDGKPQKYGTQLKPIDEWVNKTPAPFPIENKDNVNTLRASIGLYKLEDYLLIVKSKYFPKEGTKLAISDYKEKNSESGIGLQLDIQWTGSMKNMIVKTLTVARVTNGSSADKASIKVGDQIIEIDGLLVDGSNMNTLAQAMDIPAGNNVTLLIERPDGIKYTKTVKVTSKKPNRSNN
jgi:hypothetical protein